MRYADKSLDNIKCSIQKGISLKLNPEETALIVRYSAMYGIGMSRTVKKLALEYAREHESEVPKLA